MFELGPPLTWAKMGIWFTQASDLNIKMQTFIKVLTASAFMYIIKKWRECFGTMRHHEQILHDGKGYNITYQIAMLFGCELRWQAQIPREFTNLGCNFA